jgi:hypothetical protein
MPRGLPRGVSLFIGEELIDDKVTIKEEHMAEPRINW